MLSYTGRSALSSDEGPEDEMLQATILSEAFPCGADDARDQHLASQAVKAARLSPGDG